MNEEDHRIVSFVCLSVSNQEAEGVEEEALSARKDTV